MWPFYMRVYFAGSHSRKDGRSHLLENLCTRQARRLDYSAQNHDDANVGARGGGEQRRAGDAHGNIINTRL